MGSKCKKCGALSLPPRAICVSCLGTEMEWIQFKGTGICWSPLPASLLPLLIW
ncbi:MAG: hypothetical protein HXY44_11675 [Syntrophaceae bacterium]|nr:hypothetical protein [Syntrophaceae bacterium]